MQLNPPSDLAVARFTSAVQKLVGDDTRVLLAVSGGSDSLAMLLLAHVAIPERISAATVDHQLRPEAADEAAFVAALCGKLNVPHAVLQPSAPISGNLQSEARAARYALLQTRADTDGCNWIATAHHADDQGRIIRPMLAFTKTELEGICDQSGVTAVSDPSNADDSFDRVAMRQWLASTAHPFGAHRAVRTATAFTEASEALEWMTSDAFETRVLRSGVSFTLAVTDLPRELQRRLLLRILDQIQPGYVPRGDATDRALDTLTKGGQQMLGDVLCEGGESWHFRPAPQRQH